MTRSNRRRFLATAATISTGTAMAGMPMGEAAKKYPVVHHVFFWLKNPDSEEDRKKLIAGIKTLAAIEVVHDLHVGVVASTEKREVVDTSWSVSELIYFKDLEGQATYQTHPIHEAFVKNCSHLWAKVVVYDAVAV